MSEKQVKAARRNSLQVTIDVAADGRVEVGGFPANFTHAMDVMQAGVKRVMGHFIQLAMEGKLDSGGNIKQSPIIQMNPPGIVGIRDGRAN